MAILGLLLVIAAVGTGVEVALSNRAVVGGEAFGYAFPDATPMAFLLVGAGLALVCALGLVLIAGSVSRRRRRRHEAKHEARDQQRTYEELVRENEELRHELIEERRLRETLGGVAVPPGVGDVPYADQISDAVRATVIEDTGRFDPYPDEAHPGVRVDTPAGEAKGRSVPRGRT